MADRGGNIRLTTVDVELAIKKWVFESEASRGRPIRMDQIEFTATSMVQFVDSANVPQAAPPFGSVVVGWKE